MRMISSSLLAVAMLAASPGFAVADCQCLANGRKYHHGEIACLKLPNGSHLARCDMVLNNSAWMKISDGCPEASAAPFPSPEGKAARRPEAVGEGSPRRKEAPVSWATSGATPPASTMLRSERSTDGTS